MKVRKALFEELETIFLMGYDSWGGALPQKMYLDSCFASYKYKLGQFYVLVDDSDSLLSSCIVYPLRTFGGLISEHAVGIGSLATSPLERHKGYATLLLSLLIAQLEREGTDAFFVHSDIHPKIYEKLGFSPAPDEVRNKSDGAIPMIRLKGGKRVPQQLWDEMEMPEYF